VLVLALALTHVVWGVYAILALLAAASTVFNPALHAVIPALLSEEEQLAANSVAWSSERLVQIVGACVAGGLIEHVRCARVLTMRPCCATVCVAERASLMPWMRRTAA
jgi:hypothetical protein